MQYLNGTYAQAFNRRHGRKGALFGGRFKSKRVETDAQLRMTIRYIALNGFNAGIADHPRDDAWNSYPRTLGAMARWPFIATTKLLSYLGPSRRLAFRELIVLVEGRDIHRERRLRRGSCLPSRRTPPPRPLRRHDRETDCRARRSAGRSG